MKKLSIIVPVYNVEKYIDRCLKSICQQTYRNVEILCIDDGSDDKSGIICDQYAKQDVRIRVLHQKNQGVAAARNVGLRNSTGKYVGFVDPDDWIEPQMFQMIIERMEEYDADIGVCGFYKNWEDKEVEMQNRSMIDKNAFDREKLLFYAFKAYKHRSFARYIWNKIFKKELIERTKINFDDKMKMGEDVLFFGILALQVQRGVYIDKPLYHYYQRDDSLFHGGSLKWREDSLIVYERLIQLFLRNGISTDNILLVKRFYVHMASLLVEKAYLEHDFEVMRKMQKEMQRYMDAYVATSDGHEEWNEKMRLWMTDPERAIIFAQI